MLAGRRAFVVGALLLATTSWPSSAHDIYTYLKDEAGASCCNERDCRSSTLPRNCGRRGDASGRKLDCCAEMTPSNTAH